MPASKLASGLPRGSSFPELFLNDKLDLPRTGGTSALAALILPVSPLLFAEK
jgi:hypothetical protein